MSFNLAKACTGLVLDSVKATSSLISMGTYKISSTYNYYRMGGEYDYSNYNRAKDTLVENHSRLLDFGKTLSSDVSEVFTLSNTKFPVAKNAFYACKSVITAAVFTGYLAAELAYGYNTLYHYFTAKFEYDYSQYDAAKEAYEERKEFFSESINDLTYNATTAGQEIQALWDSLPGVNNVVNLAQDMAAYFNDSNTGIDQQIDHTESNNQALAAKILVATTTGG